MLVCCAFAPAPSPTRLENAQPGTSAWQLRAGGAVGLYASRPSVAAGEPVELHVSSRDAYRLVVYRLGWYGGAGARQVACLPSCETRAQGHVPLVHPGDGGAANWPVTDVLQTSATWTSGYYLVEAVLQHGGVGTTFFVLREPPGAQGSRILVQVPVSTWQAYNTWGGASLYDFVGPRSAVVSFQRPLGFHAQTPMWWEIQAVRFLEREGYDVSYQTDADTHNDPASLLRHRLVVVAGHDEYWSLPMRDAFDDAVAHGTNLAFLGSNAAYWHARFTTDGNAIVSAKSLYDPNPVLAQKTAMFREIGRPECMLMGVQHTSIAPLPRSLDYVVPDAGVRDTWFDRTGFHAGDVLAGVVGREHDALNPWPDSCIHPGLTVLFHYDGHGVDQNGDAVKFTAPSGARVFASGAQQFSWALDDWRSDGSLFPEPPVEPWRGVPVDPRLQQFMRNALDDLTRPAPPTGLDAVPIGNQIRVTVAPSTDPRVVGFVAFARSGAAWVRICKAVGATGCTGPMPAAGPLPLQVFAAVCDRWHRRSAAATVVLERHW